MSHTKGPWNVEKVTFRHSVVDNGQNGAWELVAETTSAENANLIAAAPELLHATELLLGLVEEKLVGEITLDFLKQDAIKGLQPFRDLIKKAKGEL